MLLVHERSRRNPHRFTIDASFVEEIIDTYEYLKYVEYVLENMHQSEWFLELQNQAGKRKTFN